MRYSYENNRDQAEKRNSSCKRCAAPHQFGENNPFYGKKHTQEVRDSISERRKGKRTSPATEFGKNSPNSNKKPIYQCWLEKYGKNEADKKYVEWCKTKARLGSQNGMYGKPPPKGTGNGYCGWYKGWFFRSLHELSYMINVIERMNLTWESAEKKKFAIQYIDDKDIERNYFADFFINGNILVECKPKSLHNSVIVQIKANAALKLCEEYGWIYELVAPELITIDKILKMCDMKIIQLLPKSEEKFRRKFV